MDGNRPMRRWWRNRQPIEYHFEVGAVKKNLMGYPFAGKTKQKSLLFFFYRKRGENWTTTVGAQKREINIQKQNSKFSIFHLYALLCISPFFFLFFFLALRWWRPAWSWTLNGKLGTRSDGWWKVLFLFFFPCSWATVLELTTTGNTQTDR